jgi:tetratricopeptide (TPR) repeat protein
MRKAIEQFRKLLLDFIEQRDDLMLVVACPPSEAALMLKLLLDQESNRKDDLYYLFAEDFEGGASYVDGLVARMKRDYDAALASVEDGLEPLPALPPACLGGSALARLQAALGYARGLVPPATGHRLVWGMAPGQITNLGEYTELLLACLPRPKVEPWMRGLRLLVRVPESFPDTAPLANAPRVRFRRFGIAPDAAENELRESANNRRLPTAARVQALLQLSFIDVAHGRVDVATAGFRRSLAWYQKTEDPGQQALAMVGLGDCCRRIPDIEKARYWYECAIRPAGAARQLVTLSIIAQHLAAIAYEKKQYEDAVVYYGHLVTLKRALTDEDGLVEALLWRGRAQDQAGQAEFALASWQEAMLICKTFELDHRREECLAQLRRGFQAVGQPGAAERAVEEWKNA